MQNFVLFLFLFLFLFFTKSCRKDAPTNVKEELEILTMSEETLDVFGFEEDNYFVFSHMCEKLTSVPDDSLNPAVRKVAPPAFGSANAGFSANFKYLLPLRLECAVVSGDA